MKQLTDYDRAAIADICAMCGVDCVVAELVENRAGVQWWALSFGTGNENLNIANYSDTYAKLSPIAANLGCAMGVLYYSSESEWQQLVRLANVGPQHLIRLVYEASK